MQWNADPFRQQVLGNAFMRVRNICVSGVAYAKTNIPRVPGEASPPGGFPYGKTMNLQQVITYKVWVDSAGVRGMFGVIPASKGGTELNYAYRLETGTRKMLPRPWMTLTMDEIETMYGITFKRDIGGSLARGLIRGLLAPVGTGTTGGN